jgi:hypothetical protein
MALSLARSGSCAASVAGKFFKSFLGFVVGLRVAWTHREPAIAEPREHFADRAFVQLNAELPLQFVAQIRPAPAHHPVHRRIGTCFNHRREGSSLFGREFGTSPQPLAVVEPWQALGVVAMNPVAQGLTIHAAGLRRARAIRALEHHCQAQHPSRRRNVLRPGRRRPQVRRRQIQPGNLDCFPHRCRSSPRDSIESEFR